MSQIIQGIVTEVSEKPWTDRETNENIVLYSFKVDSDGRWFRTGTTRPNCAEGQGIQFVADGQKVDPQSIAPAANVTPSAPQAPKAKSGGGNWKGKGGGGKSTENWDARAKYWEEKEKRDITVVEPRITLSAAQRDAIEVVKLAVSSESLVFGNASKKDRLDIILDAIDLVTDRFYNARLSIRAEAE